MDEDLSRFAPLYQQMRAEQFGFTLPEFCKLIQDLSGTAALSSLKLVDVLLARACARGHEPSWNRFLVLYREKLYGAALAMTKDSATARELADSMYADLFGTRTQPDGRRVSKLDYYMGRCPLEGWLRTVLAQEYVNRFRDGRKLASFDDTVEIRDQRDEDQSLSAAEQAQLARAADAALEALSAEERFLLAAYYLDGRKLAEIGRILKLHESSVSRRLEKITSALRRRIVKNLCRVGLTRNAAEQMLQIDVRDLSGNLTSVVRNRLAQERQSESFLK